MTRINIVEALRVRAPGTTHEDILGVGLAAAGVSLEFVRSWSWNEVILHDAIDITLTLYPTPDWDIKRVRVSKDAFLR